MLNISINRNSPVCSQRISCSPVFQNGDGRESGEQQSFFFVIYGQRGIIVIKLVIVNVLFLFQSEKLSTLKSFFFV